MKTAVIKHHDRAAMTIPEVLSNGEIIGSYFHDGRRDQRTHSQIMK